MLASGRAVEPAVMDATSRIRTGVAIVLAVAAGATVVLGLWLVYGLAAEYGRGAFADLNMWVVAPPILLATLAVCSFPRAPARWRVAVVLATGVVMVAGGVAADAAGGNAKHDRLVAGSRGFSCNGPNALVRVPAEVNRTWRKLPRPAPLYGPIEATATSCVAGVAGDGDPTFAAYTAAFGDLPGWRVESNEPQRLVMVRHGVRVIVSLEGAPDRLTTIEVAASADRPETHPDDRSVRRPDREDSSPG